jgi:hypothetical protein
MAAGPRQVVDPPTFTPTPFGLLTVATPVQAANGHWQNGVVYQSRCMITMGASTWEECVVVTGAGNTGPPPSKTETVDLVTRAAQPFTVYAEFDCSPVGSRDEVNAIARQALDQVASWQVERAFWTGNVGGGSPVVTGGTVFPHLAASAVVTGFGAAGGNDLPQLLQSVPVTGGPFDAAEGLGFLEQQLANCYNGVGVIHMPAIALPTFDAWGLVYQTGNQLTTRAGNKIAVGSGYPGTSPAGANPSAGTTWLYATGAVFAYAGAVRTPTLTESLDRAENTVRMLAERTYLFGWDCCHTGASITLGVPT